MKRVHAPSDLDVIGDAEAGPLPDNAMSLNGHGYDLLRIVDPSVTFAYGIVYYQSMQDLFPGVDLGPYSSVQVARIHARGTSVPYVNFLDFACFASGCTVNALNGLRSYFVADECMSGIAKSTLAFVNSEHVQTGSIITPCFNYRDVIIRCDMNESEEFWGVYGRLGNVVHYTLTFAACKTILGSMYAFLKNQQRQNKLAKVQSASTLLSLARRPKRCCNRLYL